MTTGVRHWLVALTVAASLHAALLLRLPDSSSGAQPAHGDGIEINVDLVRRAAETPVPSPSPEPATQVPQPKPAPAETAQAPQSEPKPRPAPAPERAAMAEAPSQPVEPVASTPRTRSAELSTTTPPERTQVDRRPTTAKAASTRQPEPEQASKPEPPQQSVDTQPDRGPPVRSQASAEAADGSHAKNETAGTATKQTRTTGSSSGMAKDYLVRVLAYLNRFKEYPYQARLSRQEGIAHLRFTIDRSGRILSYRLERGTDFPLLDQQALRMLEKANPLPPMPEDMQRSRMEVVLPVAFSLR